MPSQKFARAPLWCALSLALGLAFSSPQADAAGLGRLTIQSGLGQPLRAELEVTSIGRDELPTLQVKLAPLAAFRAANLEFNPALTNLRFALERRPDGTHFVRINSPQPVNEPFIDLMVELTWSTGRVIREYTVLLDPPSLRAQPEIVAPTAPAVAGAPAPARPAPATVPTPPAAATPPVGAAPPSIAATAPGSYTVKPGDTLGRIAVQNKPASVSLDQMLVAMYRANPQAFVGNNMNRLKAGATVAIPSEPEAASIAAREARREVVAQSADFAQYKSRLASAVVAAPVAETPAAAAGGGQVTTRVEDRGAPAQPTGDQLKIARVDEKGAATAAATRADEATAKARALAEEQDRADQLKKTNEAIKKALEVQSKAGAQVQQQTAPKADPGPVAAAPAQPATAEPAKAEAAPPVTAPPPAATAPAPAPTAVPAPVPAQQEPSIVSDLLGNTTTQLGLAGIAALLAGLFGWSWYRKRKLEGTDRFNETEGLQANSLFGATGGQSVDTGTSTFNSSFIPAASQLDSNEVDPVAEADVYIAYGREEQAEDILKEALRLQPDRHAVRVKLLEIYARRGDKTMFMTIVEDLKSRTGGEGEDWERAVKLGRTLDPGHAMFAGGPITEMGRTPTTAFRFDATTRSGGASTLGGGPTTGLDLSGLTANSAAAKNDTPSAPPLTRMVVDTRMSDSTTMPADTKMPADSRLGAPETVSGSTAQFHATLPGGGQPANTISTPLTPVADFGSLDFDLGPTKMNFGPTTKLPQTESAAGEDDEFSDAATAPNARPQLNPVTTGGPGHRYPAMQPTATGVGMIPDLDLNIPSTRMPVPDAEPEPEFEPVRAAADPFGAVEALARPTVVGAMKSPGVNTMVGAGWRDDASARLTANTDQATVPLIDFDLSAVAQDATRRGETEPGSALAQQMATKLDLARGYIDLGVKDGARELVDEVVRDGTREQRQAAVELIKQLES